MVEIKVGQYYEKELIVRENMLALNVGSGLVSVFATPIMIALMEEVSAKCLQQFLSSEMSSVGTDISVSHTAATPKGMKVTASATILAVNGRSVSFEVKARDDVGLIGEGRHERFIVNTDNFNKKAMSKQSK